MKKLNVRFLKSVTPCFEDGKFLSANDLRAVRITHARDEIRIINSKLVLFKFRTGVMNGCCPNCTGFDLYEILDVETALFIENHNYFEALSLDRQNKPTKLIAYTGQEIQNLHIDINDLI